MPPAIQALRVALVLVFLIAGFVIQSQYRSRGQAEAAIEIGNAEIQAVQRQLIDAQSDIDPIKNQINEIKSKRQGSGGDYELVTAGFINWPVALTALLEIKAEGLTFTSLTTPGEGKVKLSGEATGERTISQLPAKFNAIPNILDFQGIQWNLTREVPTFIAEFTVPPEVTTP